MSMTSVLALAGYSVFSSALITAVSVLGFSLSVVYPASLLLLSAVSSIPSRMAIVRSVILARCSS